MRDHRATITLYLFWGPVHYALIKGKAWFIWWSAGEHTSVNFQGYMEGGAAEGARAALEVWHALRGS